jgi:hypothetical protein
MATQFRPPLTVKIPVLPKAQPESDVNLAPLQVPVVVAPPFNLTEWPNPRPPGRVQDSDAAANLGPLQVPPVVAAPFTLADWPSLPLAKPPQASDVSASPRTLIAPNPAQPFVESHWPSLKPALPPQKSDAPDSARPILTPNPAQPFVEREWRTPARIPLSLKSDVYSWLYPLAQPNPAQPFSQQLWEGAAKPFPKAIGDATAGIAPILTPNPERPFLPLDYATIRILAKAKVDDVVNLAPLQAVVVVAAPFYQNIWDNPAKASWKVAADSVAAISPLYNPNPAQPFSLSDWPTIRQTSKAKADDVVNLAPVQGTVVAAPFYQTDWRSPTKVQWKISADSIGRVASLLTPNPAQSFSQRLWEGAAKRFSKAAGDDFINLLPLQNPPVVGDPFAQFDWDNPKRAEWIIRSDIFVDPLSIREIVEPPAVGRIGGGRRHSIKWLERQLRQQHKDTFNRRRWKEMLAEQLAERAAEKEAGRRKIADVRETAGAAAAVSAQERAARQAHLTELAETSGIEKLAGAIATFDAARQLDEKLHDLDATMATAAAAVAEQIRKDEMEALAQYLRDEEDDEDLAILLLSM